MLLNSMCNRALLFRDNRVHLFYNPINICMARKELKIEAEAFTRLGYLQEVQTVDVIWMLTYTGKLARIRINKKQHISNDFNQFSQTTFKYNKNTWTTEATAKTQIAKLNKTFKTDKFGYIKIDGKS